MLPTGHHRGAIERIGDMFAHLSCTRSGLAAGRHRSRPAAHDPHVGAVALRLAPGAERQRLRAGVATTETSRTHSLVALAAGGAFLWALVYVLSKKVRLSETIPVAAVRSRRQPGVRPRQLDK